MNILLLLLLMLTSSCTISYKLNGASIDYTTTKTISFESFPIKAPLVYAPLAVNFNDELTGKFASQTRLEQVRQDGALQISGATASRLKQSRPMPMQHRLVSRSRSR